MFDLLLTEALKKNNTHSNVDAIKRGWFLLKPCQKTTLLMAAVCSNNLEMVEVLLKKGASPTPKNMDGKNALDLACETIKEHKGPALEDALLIITLLWSKGARPLKDNWLKSSLAQYVASDTSPGEAIQGLQYEILKNILLAESLRRLTQSIKTGSMDDIKLFFENDSCLGILYRTFLGRTHATLELVPSNALPHSIDIICTVNMKSYFETRAFKLMRYACEHNNLEALKYLHNQHGFSLSSTDKDGGDTLMHRAAAKQQWEIMKYLHGRMENPHVLNGERKTPLMVCEETMGDMPIPEEIIELFETRTASSAPKRRRF